MERVKRNHNRCISGSFLQEELPHHGFFKVNNRLCVSDDSEKDISLPPELMQ